MDIFCKTLIVRVTVGFKSLCDDLMLDNKRLNSSDARTTSDFDPTACSAEETPMADAAASSSLSNEDVEGTICSV